MLAEISEESQNALLSMLMRFSSSFFRFFKHDSGQPRPQPAACEEMGLLSRGGPERSSRTRPVSEVPGVRVQL